MKKQRAYYNVHKNHVIITLVLPTGQVIIRKKSLKWWRNAKLVTKNYGMGPKKFLESMDHFIDAANYWAGSMRKLGKISNYKLVYGKDSTFNFKDVERKIVTYMAQSATPIKEDKFKQECLGDFIEHKPEENKTKVNK